MAEETRVVTRVNDAGTEVVDVKCPKGDSRGEVPTGLLGKATCGKHPDQVLVSAGAAETVKKNRATQARQAEAAKPPKKAKRAGATKARRGATKPAKTRKTTTKKEAGA